MYTIFPAFLKRLLILILYKLDNSYIFAPAKSVMHRLKLGIMFATLEQLAAEILVIFRYTPLSFSDFSLYYNVYINFREYVN